MVDECDISRVQDQRHMVGRPPHPLDSSLDYPLSARP
jgi:hypothetical protein